VCWDRKLESAELRGDKVELHFAGAESVSADVAIGCDGANSRLRAVVTDVPPRYVGVTLIEGYVPAAKDAVPEILSLMAGPSLMALGNERTLGLGTKPDGGILFYAGLKSMDPEDKRRFDDASQPASRVAWFHKNFEGWSDRWTPLFAKASSAVWRPLLACPADQHWDAKPNVTLLGDAAHVMPPYAGEGVNMAMLDALVLSQEMFRQSDAASAIAAYEAEMFARMKPMTKDTMQNTEMFYAADASDQIVRMFQSFGRRSTDSAADAP
jgi:2-polyprenyl-6-methoxyphenol hydroxylase-like FAD-dependent oxidoreductase